MKKRYVALIAGVILLLCVKDVVTLYVFTFLYQVRTQKVFLVTISCFGERCGVISGYLWKVNIQQLSHEELHPVPDSEWEAIADATGDHEMEYWHATVIVDENGSGPFPGDITRSTTLDGRTQMTYGIHPQPTNITIIWDGGREVFLFRPSPIYCE